MGKPSRSNRRDSNDEKKLNDLLKAVRNSDLESTLSILKESPEIELQSAISLCCSISPCCLSILGTLLNSGSDDDLLFSVPRGTSDIAFSALVKQVQSCIHTSKPRISSKAPQYRFAFGEHVSSFASSGESETSSQQEGCSNSSVSGLCMSWGSTGNSVLGYPTHSHKREQIRPRIVQSLPPEICSVACSNLHACAVSTDGHLFVWGNGMKNRLGIGERSLRQSSVKVEPVEIRMVKEGLEGVLHPISVSKAKVLFRKVVCTESVSIALSHDHRTYVWGSCSDPRYCHAIPTNVPLFNKVTSRNRHAVVTDIFASSKHIVFVVDDHLIFSAGLDVDGSLGYSVVGSSRSHWTPRVVSWSLPSKEGSSSFLSKISVGDGYTTIVYRTREVKQSLGEDGVITSSRLSAVVCGLGSDSFRSVRLNEKVRQVVDVGAIKISSSSDCLYRVCAIDDRGALHGAVWGDNRTCSLRRIGFKEFPSSSPLTSLVFGGNRMIALAENGLMFSVLFEDVQKFEEEPKFSCRLKRISGIVSPVDVSLTDGNSIAVAAFAVPSINRSLHNDDGGKNNSSTNVARKRIAELFIKHSFADGFIQCNSSSNNELIPIHSLVVNWFFEEFEPAVDTAGTEYSPSSSAFNNNCRDFFRKGTESVESVFAPQVAARFRSFPWSSYSYSAIIDFLQFLYGLSDFPETFEGKEIASRCNISRSHPPRCISPEYLQKNCSDVVLHSEDGEDVAANRSLLSISPYFASMFFSSHWTESESGVISVSFPADTVRNVVRYLSGHPCIDIRVDNAISLLVASDAWLLPSLSHVVQTFMIQYVDASNAIPLLPLAISSNASLLAQLCAETICWNLCLFCETGKFAELPIDALHVVDDVWRTEIGVGGGGGMAVLGGEEEEEDTVQQQEKEEEENEEDSVQEQKQQEENAFEQKAEAMEKPTTHHHQLWGLIPTFYEEAENDCAKGKKKKNRGNQIKNIPPGIVTPKKKEESETEEVLTWNMSNLTASPSSPSPSRSLKEIQDDQKREKSEQVWNEIPDPTPFIVPQPAPAPSSSFHTPILPKRKVEKNRKSGPASSSKSNVSLGDFISPFVASTLAADNEKKVINSQGRGGQKSAWNVPVSSTPTLSLLDIQKQQSSSSSSSSSSAQQSFWYIREQESLSIPPLVEIQKEEMEKAKLKEEKEEEETVTIKNKSNPRSRGRGRGRGGRGRSRRGGAGRGRGRGT